ncbi:MAG: methylenetetrahydrofolate reductase [Acidimicrobiales bacterium]
MAPSKEVEARIALLARTGDIELIPMKSVKEQLSVVPKDTTVAVTCSAKFGIDRTVDYAELLAKAGHRIRVHLPARQVPDRAYLAELVERLGSLGVQELHVVGGDVEEPVGKYGAAAELIEDLSTMEHGFDISVACYPEGHPHISDKVLMEALQRKQPYATFMINQLCFDPGVLVSWLRSMREAGITLPLRMGLAPPISPTKLLDLSMKIGVGTSMRYLSKQHGMLGTLLRGKFYKPERLLAQLGDALVSPEMHIDGLHIFSFNQLQHTVEWQQRVGGHVG